MSYTSQLLLKRCLGLALYSSLTLVAPSLAQEQERGGNGSGTEVKAESGLPEAGKTLSEYTTDLTKQAQEGNYKDLVVRHELQRSLADAINSGRSVYLVGEAGAGKTTLVQTAANELPGKRIVELNVGKFLAGTSYRGDLETRITGLVNDMLAENGKTILFIDEIHVVRNTPGFFDLLKPHLATGKILLIGGTTFNEFREHIEKDRAMTTRGTQLTVPELTRAELLTVLRARKSAWMQQYGVLPTEGALKAAVDLAFRYFSAEAPSRTAENLIKTALQVQKSAIEQGSGRLLTLQTQLQDAKLEAESTRADLRVMPNDGDLQSRLTELQSLSSRLESEIREMQSHVDNDRAVREQLTDLERQAVEAERAGNLELASRLRYQVIPPFQQRLKNPNTAVPFISEADIQKEVATRMRVPVEMVTSDTQSQVQRLDSELRNSVKGQEHVINEIVREFELRKANVIPSERPISVMLGGQTGTGKTLTAQTMAKALGMNLVRLDMQQYREAHSISRLQGAPPGYVGTGEGGQQLTEPVRRNPYSIVLVDEFDRAHRDVRQFFMRILDEGYIQDADGRNIDFRNSIVIFTTNIGEQYALMKEAATAEEMNRWLEEKEIDRKLLEGKDTVQKDEIILRELLRQAGFEDAELNRFGLLMVPNALSMDVAKQIVRLELRKIVEHNRSVRGVEIVFTDKAVDALARASYDPRMGARPIRRTIERSVGQVLARGVNQSDWKRGDRVRLVFNEKSNMIYSVVTKAAAESRPAETRDIWAESEKGRGEEIERRRQAQQRRAAPAPAPVQEAAKPAPVQQQQQQAKPQPPAQQPRSGVKLLFQRADTARSAATRGRVGRTAPKTDAELAREAAAKARKR